MHLSPISNILARNYGNARLSIFERLVNQGLGNLAQLIYNFDPNVLTFNDESTLPNLLSDPRLEGLARHVFTTEAGSESQSRRDIVVVSRPIPNSRNGRATPIEIAVMRGSAASFWMLLPLVLNVTPRLRDRRSLVASLMDYAIRLAPTMLIPVQQAATTYAQMTVADIAQALLGSGHFESAFSYQRDRMNENEFVIRLLREFGRFVDTENREAIEAFFSVESQLFSPGSLSWTDLRRRLVEESLMGALGRAVAPNRQQLVSISLTLLEHLRDSLSDDQRTRARELASRTGQEEAEQWLAAEEEELVSLPSSKKGRHQ